MAADRSVLYAIVNELPVAAGVLGSGKGTAAIQIFSDNNRDSQMNNNEHGLPDAVVALILEGGPEGDSLVSERITAEDGLVTFSGLPAGTYRIRVTLPAGQAYCKKSEKRISIRQNIMDNDFARTAETPSFTLGEGESFECAAAAMPTSTLTGRVWQDDGDGAMEADEPGIAGVVMEAESVRTGARVQTVTGEDGSYTFIQLKAGDYFLRCYLPEGQMFTVTNNSVNYRQRTVIGGEGRGTGRKNFTVERDKNITDQNVGLIPGATVRMAAFVDDNRNGVYDEGEAPLPGVIFFLMRQSNGNELANVTSGADGTASFGALRIGTYKIKARIPEGWHYTIRGTGEGANRFYEESRRDDVLNNVSVTDAGQTITIYVGAYQYASVSGTVYLDQNYSGAMENDERRLEGLTVALLGEDRLVKATAKTNANGEYRFTDLLPGTYTMTLTSLAEHAFTLAGEGNVMINRGAGAGSTDPFHLGSGESRTGMNAGMIRPAKLQGVFYADLNDNGRQDPGEGSLPGAAVVLIDEAGAETAVTPAENGSFLIDSILPGTYSVRWDLPEDCVFCEVPDDMIAEGGSLRYHTAFTLSSGNLGTFLPVGAISLAHVSGVVFEDPDADGVRGNAKGLSGAEVTLTPAREGSDPVTAVTGEDGSFALDGLRPGAWKLTVTMPEGLVLSRQADVALPLTTGERTQTVDMTVEMGARIAGQMLGAVQPASIRGAAWLDENNDGLRGADEKTLKGEVITLVDLADGEGTLYAETTVDEDGGFAFDGVIPGRYRLEYALAANTVSAESGDTTFAAGEDVLFMDGLELASGQLLDTPVLGVKRFTSLAGRAWFDRGGEVVAVEAAAVQLLTADGAVIADTATDVDGAWRFDGLMPGEYRIAVSFPTGSVPVETDDERLADGSLISVLTAFDGHTGTSDVIDLRMGADRTNLDAGSVSPGILGDLVWLDVNGDGLQASDEGGIPNVTVHLWRGGAEVASTVTDQYGFYRFEELYPASYTLTVDADGVMPTVQRTDVPNIVSVMGGDGVSVPVQVYSGTHNYNADMGFIPLTEGAFPAGYGEGATQQWK